MTSGGVDQSKAAAAEALEALWLRQEEESKAKKREETIASMERAGFDQLEIYHQLSGQDKVDERCAQHEAKKQEASSSSGGPPVMPENATDLLVASMVEKHEAETKEPVTSAQLKRAATNRASAAKKKAKKNAKAALPQTGNALSDYMQDVEFDNNNAEEAAAGDVVDRMEEDPFLFRRCT
jgi:hypothetical protein